MIMITLMAVLLLRMLLMMMVLLMTVIMMIMVLMMNMMVVIHCVDWFLLHMHIQHENENYNSRGIAEEAEATLATTGPQFSQ